MPLLTVAAVRKYVAGTTRREIRDTGAPSLYLIVQPKPKGSKVWAMRFVRPDGRTAKLTLGPVELGTAEPDDDPVLGGALTLRQARQLANSIDRQRARGVDVVDERKAEQSRVQAAEANSFGAVARDFFIMHKVRKWQARPRHWRADARLLGLVWPAGCEPATTAPTIVPGSLVATWGSKPITTIDAHAIYTAVDEARQYGIPGLARHNAGVSEARGRKMHAALSGVFRWALQHRKIINNPTIGVWHPGAPPARERVLTDDELGVFWHATDQLAPPLAAVFKLLLLSGCRLNEVAGMQHSELAGEVWTIPGSRTKNHRAHTLVLPPLACAIIAAAPRVESAAGYIFTTNGKRPISGWSKAKAQLDDHMAARTPWRIHDLRRSCASGMQKLGVRVEVIERALNHLSGSYMGVAGIYQRDPMLEETTAAFARWAAHVEGIVTRRPANITPLRRQR